MPTLTKLIHSNFTKSAITNYFPSSKAFSGKEILDNLVLVANQADKQINPQLLSQFYHPFDGVYLQYIQEIVSSLNLNERSLYHPHQPIGQYNKQYHHFQKNDILPFFSQLKYFDSNTFNQLSSNDSLLLVNYHLWYNLNDSPNYFYDNPIPSIIADNKRIPNQLKQKVSQLYENYLKSKGLKKISDVEQEIVNLLTPHRCNKYPLEILTPVQSDLFQYQDRLFSLRQKNKPSQNESTITHHGDWLDLIWSLGIYTNTTQLIGYIPFNKEINKTTSLLFP